MTHRISMLASSENISQRLINFRSPIRAKGRLLAFGGLLTLSLGKIFPLLLATQSTADFSLLRWGDCLMIATCEMVNPILYSLILMLWTSMLLRTNKLQEIVLTGIGLKCWFQTVVFNFCVSPAIVALATTLILILTPEAFPRDLIGQQSAGMLILVNSSKLLIGLSTTFECLVIPALALMIAFRIRNRSQAVFLWASLALFGATMIIGPLFFGVFIWINALFIAARSRPSQVPTAWMMIQNAIVPQMILLAVLMLLAPVVTLAAYRAMQRMWAEPAATVR